MNDERIVYAVGCTWWDSIDQVGKHPENGLPCCPKCKSMLLEIDNIAEWDKGVLKYESDGHPGYSKMINWMRGKCFPNMRIAQDRWDRLQRGDGLRFA